MDTCFYKAKRKIDDTVQDKNEERACNRRISKFIGLSNVNLNNVAIASVVSRENNADFSISLNISKCFSNDQYSIIGFELTSIILLTRNSC